MRYGPFLLILICLGAAGCASTGGGDAGDEIRELREHVLELQRKAAVNEVEIERLRQQIAELQAQQGGRSAPGTSGPRPSGAELRSLPATPYPPPGRPSASVRDVPAGREAPAIEEVDIEVPTAGSRRGKAGA
ncbi:MAG: hypothetical protein M3O15_14315, partial [Acidobacteriota bacterium]|nr:hypothetical protein [Acidobacteriota bacterium]